MTTPRPSDDQAPRSVARVAQGARNLPALDRALADLREAETLVPLVALLRNPSMRRPWRERHIDAYARAELDDEARAELADRNADAPGEHQDAARPDVLDLLTEILQEAEGLAWDLSRAARCPVMRPARATSDPRPYLARARATLITACKGWPNGDEIAHYAADTAAGMLAELRAALALVEDGHTVKAVCPWCRGGLRGAYTWRVRLIVGEPVIVCESDECNPPMRDAGTWVRGRPAWRLGDWAWLAARLDHLDARRAVQAPPPRVRPAVDGATGRAGSPITPDAEHALLAGVLDHERPA